MAYDAVDDTLDILLVEDNPGDVLLTRRAMQREKIGGRLHDVPDGMTAIAFLTRNGTYANAPRPDLVLLDLNLPGMKGADVLRAMKSDQDLSEIPVIILSTSGDPKDVAMSYRDHANCYIRKPSEIGAFREVIRRIDEFWFSTAELPES